MIKIPALDGIEASKIDEIAKEMAELLKADRLKTHQLRNVYSAVERMRSASKSAKNQPAEERVSPYDFVKHDLILLKPKIAYAAGRQKSVRYNFYPFMVNAIDAVVASSEKDKALKNFFALMESLVGYHKFFENN